MTLIHVCFYIYPILSVIIYCWLFLLFALFILEFLLPEDMFEAQTEFKIYTERQQLLFHDLFGSAGFNMKAYA